jgi:hypothetical protein
MITSWSAQGGGTAAGRAQLRVYRPTGTKGQFKLIRQSEYETIPADGHPKFPVRLKVRGGDLLGILTLENLASGYNNGVERNLATIPLCHPDLGGLIGAETDCPLLPLTTSLINMRVTLSPL